MIKSKFYKIGVYRVYREFGGHEEGGWYYNEYDRVNDHEVTKDFKSLFNSFINPRFSNRPTAYKWANYINKHLEKNGLIMQSKQDDGSMYHWKEDKVVAMVFPNGTPETYPKSKPIYC